MSCDLDPETITFSGNCREVLKRSLKDYRLYHVNRRNMQFLCEGDSQGLVILY